MNSRKLAIIGEGGVGKTSIVNRIRWNDFTPNYIATIGVQVTNIDNLEIWDTAGQKKFQGLGEGNIIGSDYVMIVFSITNINSFNTITRFINKAKNVAPFSRIFLVSNKNDEDNKVSKESIQQYIQSRQDIDRYFEISCKQDTGFEELETYINGLISPAGV